MFITPATNILTYLLIYLITMCRCRWQYQRP